MMTYKKLFYGVTGGTQGAGYLMYIVCVGDFGFITVFLYNQPAGCKSYNRQRT